MDNRRKIAEALDRLAESVKEQIRLQKELQKLAQRAEAIVSGNGCANAYCATPEEYSIEPSGFCYDCDREGVGNE